MNVKNKGCAIMKSIFALTTVLALFCSFAFAQQNDLPAILVPQHQLDHAP
jgi:hypothetical protein